MANLSETPKYTLTITSADTSVPNLVLSENDVTEFNKVRVSLISLEITKQMYEPCKIEALIQFMDGDKKNADSKDSNMATIDSLSKLLGKKVELTDGVDKNPIAKDYVLCDFEPEFRPGNGPTNLYVKLSIYSPEKLLTYTKGNSCYVAEKLSEVFEKIAKDGGINPEKKNLQNLTISLEKKGDESNTSEKIEFIQPYMVQFEETLVEFLSRMANRCGEFLFFEDGKWQLGANSGASSKDIDKYVSLSFRKYSAQNQHLYSINDYIENSTSISEDAEKAKKLAAYKATTEYTSLADDKKEEAEKKWNEEYDKCDKFKTITQYTGPSDEYLKSIQKDDEEGFWNKFSSDFVSGFNNTIKNPSWYIKKFPIWLKQDNIIKMLSKQLQDFVVSQAESAEEALNYKSEFNEDYINPFKDKPEQYEDKGNDGCFAFPLTSKFGEKEFSSKFYCLIEEKERESERLMIHVCMGSNYTSLHLGDVVKIMNKAYLIIKISNEIKADNTGNEKLFSNLEFDAVPIVENTSYPIPLPGGTIKTSEAQLAIVSSTKDPVDLGRIQISYPWQNKGNSYTSPWIRISTPCNTKGGGFKFMPQEGDEIMVGYENGNIERPYMIGSLPTKGRSGANNNYMLKSPNGQYIKFDNSNISVNDLVGTFLPAQNIAAKMFPDSKVDLNGEITKYGGGIEIGDKLGFYKVSMSSSDRAINISSTWGDVSISAFTGINISSPNGDINISGKNVSITAGNDLILKSGVNFSKKKYGFYLNNKLRLLGATGLNIAAEILNFKVDLSLVRHLTECIFKPIGGTMLIKSSRFMRLEAGNGKTMLPIEENDAEDIRFNEIKAYNAIRTALNAFDKMVAKNRFLLQSVGYLQTEYNKKIEALATKATNTENNKYTLKYDNKKFEAEKIKSDDKNFLLKTIIDDCVKDNTYTVDKAMENINKLSFNDDKGNEKVEFTTAKNDIIPVLESLIKDIHTRKKIGLDDTEIEKVVKGSISLWKTSSLIMEDKWTNDNTDEMCEIVAKAIVANKNKIDELFNNFSLEGNVKALKRKVLYDVLQGLKKADILSIDRDSKWDTFYNLFDEKQTLNTGGIQKKGDEVCKNAKDWKKFLNSIQACNKNESITERNKKARAVYELSNIFIDNDDKEWAMEAGADAWDRLKSTAAVHPKIKGEILMSDTSGNTVNINGTTVRSDATSIISKMLSELGGI